MIPSGSFILGFPLVFLPSIFPSRTVLSNQLFPLSVWPIQFLCLSWIASISDRCSPTIMNTCSFVIWSDQLMFSISSKSTSHMLLVLWRHHFWESTSPMHTQPHSKPKLSPFVSWVLSIEFLWVVNTFCHYNSLLNFFWTSSTISYCTAQISEFRDLLYLRVSYLDCQPRWYMFLEIIVVFVFFVFFHIPYSSDVSFNFSIMRCSPSSESATITWSSTKHTDWTSFLWPLMLDRPGEYHKP